MQIASICQPHFSSKVYANIVAITRAQAKTKARTRENKKEDRIMNMSTEKLQELVCTPMGNASLVQLSSLDR